MTYKDEFLSLVGGYIKRDGVKELVDMLEKTDFYIAPASTRYHEAHEGGLVEHTVKVFHQLLAGSEDILSKYSKETIAIIALFHDLCKIGFYKVDYRNAKNDKGKWERVPYYTVDDTFPYGHGEKSVYLLQQFIKLSDDEAMAIRWHMGAYEGEKSWVTLGRVYKDCPLALELHCADMRATYYGGN